MEQLTTGMVTILDILARGEWVSAEALLRCRPVEQTVTYDDLIALFNGKLIRARATSKQDVEVGITVLGAVHQKRSGSSPQWS